MRTYPENIFFCIYKSLQVSPHVYTYMRKHVYVYRYLISQFLLFSTSNAMAQSHAVAYLYWNSIHSLDSRKPGVGCEWWCQGIALHGQSWTKILLRRGSILIIVTSSLKIALKEKRCPFFLWWCFHMLSINVFFWESWHSPCLYNRFKNQWCCCFQAFQEHQHSPTFDMIQSASQGRAVEWSCDTSNDFCLPPQDTYANFRKSTVDGRHPAITTWDVKETCKQWDKLPTSNPFNWFSRQISEPSKPYLCRQNPKPGHCIWAALARGSWVTRGCTTRIIFPIATSGYLVIFLNAIILIFIWYQY